MKKNNSYYLVITSGYATSNNNLFVYASTYRRYQYHIQYTIIHILDCTELSALERRKKQKIDG